MSEHKPAVVKYGKPSGPLLSQKQSYLTDNARFIAEHQKICALYAQQPARTRCKNCEAELGAADFVKQGVPYGVCSHCGHLNGLHEDTAEFCQAVYADDGGKDYAKTYQAADREAYDNRVRDIYVPKAEFLAEVLAAEGLRADATTVADFGAGSGYMVKAMRAVGLSDACGLEVSQQQVDLANAMIGEEAVKIHGIEDTVELARNAQARVVTMIGVLEHLVRPRDVLAAICENSQVEYIMISVPLFSPCVFIEMAFDTVMHRQLTAGHTHLYTEQSLDHMCREYDLARVGEWWFGTDMVDLYRSMAVKLGQDADTEKMAATWMEMIAPAIDGLQMQMDERHMSSEVHMVLKKK